MTNSSKVLIYLYFLKKAMKQKRLQSQINQKFGAVKISKFNLKLSLTSNSEKSYLDILLCTSYPIYNNVDPRDMKIIWCTTPSV